MNLGLSFSYTCRALGMSVALITFVASMPVSQAASLDIANVPMAVRNSVTPNVLVIYDNSQSMDAYMNGTMVSGNDPNTRSTIGRTAMRDAITSYRTAFNWGLMTYGMKTNPPGLYNIYAYYLGSDSGMQFTNDCTGYVSGTPPVPGISASNGNRRCVANPQPFSGGNFVIYDKTGDDPDIQDVLYWGSGAFQSSMWGLTAGPGTSFKIYGTHNTASGNSWATSAFSGDPFGCGNCAITFTPTDAGYLASNPPLTRQLYLPRGWGYLSDITGVGTINRAVQADSAAHYSGLMTLLGNETNGATGEVKNGALFTPLRGALSSAKTYFATSYESNASPIAYSCQQNFVMMVTDGLPTGKTDGSLYSAADRTNTYNSSTNTWSFGPAATEAIDAVTALRTTTNSKKTTPFDIQTYVLALGDTVANANAVAVMNAMANAGGTGSALFANNTASFKSAIGQITDNITAKTGAAAAVAVANAHVTSTDNASYASSYNSGTWTGDLDAFAIDILTGLPSTTSMWTSGSAQTQLDLIAPSARKIATSTDTAGAIGGVQFQPTTASTTTKLSTAQQTLLNSPSVSPVDGAAVLSYLRGDRSGETSGKYRPRAHLLGDIVNAEPALVREPTADYADTGYLGSSTTFRESNATRQRMVYQGANDGMLHAFNATTGAEEWAYIPNLVFANLNSLSSKASFTHKYYVDGTPVAGDVDFKNVAGATGSGTDWRTILVGGLGKGGRGYYALDVTNPIAANEAAVASKVLWEFPNSITNSAARASAKLNMGFSFGKPIIVKTEAEGWVVLVTSGYNNGTNSGDSGGDGLGHLYVINPKTGDLIKDIPTTGCNSTPTSTPCGLAQISAYVENWNVDNTTDFVYGGDLSGNVWRFNLTGNSKASWSVSKLAVLKDASGAVQPITTTPELSKIKISGSDKRFVYVGTGQYFGDTDVPCPTSGCPTGKTQNANATQTQTMYALVDDTVSTLADPVRTVLQQQTMTTSGTKRNISNNAVDYTTKKGWYVDLPTTGERINSDPSLASGALIFTSNIPDPTICVPGGSSWLYFIDYKTGGLVSQSTATWSGTELGQKLASRPVIIQLPSGKVVALIRLSDATTVKEDAPLSNATSLSKSKRVSWREILE